MRQQLPASGAQLRASRVDGLGSKGPKGLVEFKVQGKPSIEPTIGA